MVGFIGVRKQSVINVDQDVDTVDYLMFLLL